MALPATAGAKIRASDFNTATQQAAWTVFTPTWTAVGSAPSLGNGFITGGYSKIGRLCTFRWAVQFGSTTTFGTGAWLISLPFSPALGLHADTMVGTAYGFKSGVANYAGVSTVGNLTPSTTALQMADDGNSTSWGSTIPVVWAANAASYFGGMITYETTT